MKLNPDIITSRRNPAVLLAASLTEKKYREEHRLFLAEGVKLFSEAVASQAPIHAVMIAESSVQKHLPFVQQKLAGGDYRETTVSVLSDDCFAKISTEKSPEGLIVLIKHLDISKKYIKIIEGNALDGQRALFLSSIRDPGNLGTILRSAGAFGVGCVILSEDCADLYNPRTVRAAMGALFRVPTLRVRDSEEAVRELCRMGHRVFAAELRPGAVDLTTLSLKPEDVFVIGNEGHGIPPSLSALCTGSVYIPISPNAESLNAAIAASVILWEAAKGS